MALLKISHLNIHFHSKSKVIPILEDINFAVEKNTIFGISGESGSGKSLLALSIMGLYKDLSDLKVSGSVTFNGKELIGLPENKWTSIRGNKISMIFQNPEAALNPVIKCGKQIAEIIKLHQAPMTDHSLKQKVNELLISVGFSDPLRIYQAYPFELSGGQQQRIVIAIAIANQPDLIIADEPTSNLDIHTSAEIIELLINIKTKNECSIVFITHDIELLQRISDRIFYIQNGHDSHIAKTVQNLSFQQFFNERYVSQTLDKKQGLISSNDDGIILSIEGMNKSYFFGGWLEKKKKINVLADICFSIKKGRVLGIMGQTGSGKSTLAKIIAGVIDHDDGQVMIDDILVNCKTYRQNKDLRRSVQLVFQDSYQTFNPMHTVKEILSEIIQIYNLALEKSTLAIINELLKDFGLSEDILNNFPMQLSGGQRQRLAIARVLLIKPKIIIFDESFSGLDIENQINVLKIMEKMKSKYPFTIIFISHDPHLIKAISDEVLVLDAGRIIEHGNVSDIFGDPKSNIIKKLKSR